MASAAPAARAGRWHSRSMTASCTATWSCPSLGEPDRIRRVAAPEIWKRCVNARSRPLRGPDGTGRLRWPAPWERSAVETIRSVAVYMSASDPRHEVEEAAIDAERLRRAFFNRQPAAAGGGVCWSRVLAAAWKYALYHKRS